MIVANFNNNERSVYKFGLEQYDYGQILRIKGLSLPDAVEIHFSLQEKGGEAVRRMGTTQDGVTDVVIPDFMLENPAAHSDSYYIFAFIYLTDETSGHTEYRITMNVKTRPKPADFLPPDEPDFAQQLINTVAKEREAAQGYAEEAGNIRTDVSGMVEQALQANNSAIESAKNAMNSERNAGTYCNETKTVYETAKLSEDERQKAESERVSSEQERVKAENIRVQNEEKRQADNKVIGDKIDELKSDLGNVSNDLTMLRAQACIFVNESDILGVQVDYKNKTFTRLAGAVNLTKGSDFDRFSMFGGRRRCNVADDGTIVAWYGDADYAEDGSMGQVMVYQPKFYYLVCPVVYDPIDTGVGYHLRKANYYVSETQRAGFKLHPAFYDKNGNEVDYILMSAYEGCIYDTSANAYLKNDEQVMDASKDKFSSIAGARPATGVSQNLTRPNIEQMAKNRGEGWHSFGIKTASMEQLLMIVEMGTMNLQTAIGQGIVNIPWTTGSDTTSSYAGVTGSTASLGNGTGRATETTTYEGGVATNNTADGKTSICYRGVENFWGNIWKFAYGVNIWGNGKMAGGMPYICSDFNYAEGKNTDNYEGAGFTVTPKEGYISAMGYSTKYDWLFMASECLGNSSLPVGDYNYTTQNLNEYRIARLGGSWNNGSTAGGFYWALTYGVGFRNRAIGGRLVYVPTVTV